MSQVYNAWYRDTHIPINNIISNPNFKGEFKYAPYQEYDDDNQHCFQDMTLGDWVWKKAVSAAYFFFFFDSCYIDIINQDAIM